MEAKFWFRFRLGQPQLKNKLNGEAFAKQGKVDKALDLMEEMRQRIMFAFFKMTAFCNKWFTTFYNTNCGNIRICHVFMFFKATKFLKCVTGDENDGHFAFRGDLQQRHACLDQGERLSLVACQRLSLKRSKKRGNPQG